MNGAEKQRFGKQHKELASKTEIDRPFSGDLSWGIFTRRRKKMEKPVETS
jgi:hypothetical protein